MTASQKQFFVLVSGFVKADRRRGIDRVVRNILGYLLQAPPKGFIVCPVYTCSEKEGLFHANEMLRKNYGIFDRPSEDTPVFWGKSDFLLLNMDRYKRSDCDQKDIFFQMHKDNVQIWTLIYDLWAAEHTEWYVQSRSYEFTTLMHMIDRFDGIICDSRSVAKKVSFWLAQQQKGITIPVRAFHLGCTIDNEYTDRGLPANANAMMAQFKQRPTFMTVATLKPRKRHLQALRAFENLWGKNYDVNFLLVGSKPTEDHVSAEKLINNIENHPELGKRLFWIHHASDEYVAKLYQSVSALLVPSEDEGFGLPVVEAAQYGLPLILRDIDIFHEVAGEHAFYFKGFEPTDLSDALEQWLELYTMGKEPSTRGMKILTWKESAQMLLRELGLC